MDIRGMLSLKSRVEINRQLWRGWSGLQGAHGEAASNRDPEATEGFPEEVSN